MVCQLHFRHYFAAQVVATRRGAVSPPRVAGQACPQHIGCWWRTVWLFIGYLDSTRSTSRVLLGMGRPACVWEVGVLFFFCAAHLRDQLLNSWRTLSENRCDSCLWRCFFELIFLWYTTGTYTLQSTFVCLLGYLPPKEKPWIFCLWYFSLSWITCSVFMAK